MFTPTHKKNGMLFGLLMRASQAYADTQISEDTNHVIKYMGDHKVSSFIMIDKKMGQTHLIENGKVKSTFNALSGKIAGDGIEGGMTPAGVFSLERVDGLPTYQSALIFNYKSETNKYTAIHAVLDVKGENRSARLTSKTATDNKISHDGCINVFAKDLKAMLEFTTNASKYIHTDRNDYFYAPNGFLVVLPEKSNATTFFKIQTQTATTEPH